MDGHIDDPEIERLAHEVASMEGSTPNDAMRHALEERKARLRMRRKNPKRAKELIARLQSLPVIDPRHHDEILYDEDGLPK